MPIIIHNKKITTNSIFMSIQEIQGYFVLDNGKPAIMEDSKVWNKHFYTDFGQALGYAKNWLGEYDTLPENYQGDPYDYSGYGDKIEIRYSLGIEM
jgi:hypothetical protein